MKKFSPILRQWEAPKCWISPFHGAGTCFAPLPAAVPDLCLSRVSEDVGGVLVWKLAVHMCWQSHLTELWEPLANAASLEAACFSWVLVRLG